jgi:Fe-S-cluster containining protein
MSEIKTWYHEGLKFTCSQCGDCCTGAPGFVWLNKTEIAALAKRLDVDEETFEANHVMRVGIRKSLKELSNGDCVLFDAEKRCCTVYEDRPRQCRTWPFWDSNLRSPETWAETCEACPGSGQGTLHQLAVIEEQRNVMEV